MRPLLLGAAEPESTNTRMPASAKFRRSTSLRAGYYLCVYDVRI